jgi:hypothetical protein
MATETVMETGSEMAREMASAMARERETGTGSG